MRDNSFCYYNCSTVLRFVLITGNANYPFLNNCQIYWFVFELLARLVNKALAAVPISNSVLLLQWIPCNNEPVFLHHSHVGTVLEIEIDKRVKFRSMQSFCATFVYLKFTL